MAVYAPPRFTSRMRLPTPLLIELSSSRLATALVVGIAVATIAALATLPLPWLALATAVVTVVAWAIDRVRVVALRTSHRSVAGISLTGDRLIVVRYRTGRLVAGFVRASSYVSPSLTSIVWKPDDKACSQALLILPDMLSADDFRRLRVMLRYGRSEALAGVPASHA